MVENSLVKSEMTSQNEPRVTAETLRDNVRAFLDSPATDGYYGQGSTWGYHLKLFKEGSAPFDLQINYIGLHENSRGKGVFTEFLGWLEEEPDVSRIALVNVKNDRLRAFLSRRGYACRGDHDYVFDT
jgi:hypothetical protein